MIIKQHDRCQESDDDGQAGREAFHDVIRVLDDDGRNEPSKRLYPDRRPCPCTKVAENIRDEAFGVGRLGVVKDGDKGGDEGEE